MNDAIRAWLNGGRPYAAGIEIYSRSQPDAQLLKRLVTGDSESNKKALFNALRQCLAVAVAPAIPKPAETPTIENPASMEAKRTADKLYKGMMNLRAQLLVLTPLDESPLDTDPEHKKTRGLLAREIVYAKREVDQAYDDYRYAREHGVPREKPKPVLPDADPLLLPGLISNLRKRLSKLRKMEQSDRIKSMIAEKEQLLTNYLEQYERAKAGRSGSAE